MNSSRLLAAILVLFALLGALYALVTPLFEASDELWHYPMVRHLADGNPLPVQVFDAADAGPWKQEASQPPLYYYLGAALTFWIDQSDMDQIRWLNPHVDNGVITVDGNINLAVHDPDVDPWRGTALAVRIVRLMSVLLGTVTVYLTYHIGIEVVPGRVDLALAAAALNAFTPMFLFISGAVNNDNLAIPLASLALLLMIRAVKKARSFRYWLGLGTVIGLALLTKEGTFALIPLAWGTTFICRWKADAAGENSRPPGESTTLIARLIRVIARSSLHFLLVMTPALLIAGWWYLRNVRLYGDWLGWSAFIAVLGQRAQPAALAQLWSERQGFLMSYWGLFGGVNVPMAPWIYRVLNGALLLSIAGFTIFAVRLARRSWSDRRGRANSSGSLAAFALDAVTENLGLVMSLLFSAAVVYGLIQWATTTWSSQGRLVFTAISALSLLMVIGLAGWIPRRPARTVLSPLILFMFVVSAVAPFAWIRRAYLPDTYSSGMAPDLQMSEQEFSTEGADHGSFVLTGHQLFTQQALDDQVRPGEAVDVILKWQVLAPEQRDWSLFVHLVDPVLGYPVAQRDMYPEQGLRSTRLMEQGDETVSYLRLKVPDTAVAPARLEVVAGWYDFVTNERMHVEGVGDAVLLGRLDLIPRPGSFPNPVDVDFGNELQLLGFELAPRRLRAGETIRLNLQWRALKPLSTDYTFFVQVVDEDTTRWASHDLAPSGGTSAWDGSEVHQLEMSLVLSEETPPDVYPIHLGVYVRTPNGFRRLQIVNQEGRITQEDFLKLTDVRVD